MTVIERFKAPTKSARDRAKDMSSRATEAAAKTRDKAAEVAKSAMSDDARRELTEALELIVTKVRESATLAKLQDEAHRQLSDALDLAREKVKEAAPAAKAKLQDASHDAVHHPPPKPTRPSKLRTVMMLFMVTPLAIGAIVALKKRLFSSKEPVDDYDAGGELAWGESSFNPASASSTADAEASNVPYEPAVMSSVPASAVGPSIANGVASGRESRSSGTPDAPNSELLSE